MFETLVIGTTPPPMCLCRHVVTIIFVDSFYKLCCVSLQVHYIAMAAVVWMFTRYDLPKSFRLPVTVLLALCVYKAFLMEWVWLSKCYFVYSNVWTPCGNETHIFAFESKEVTSVVDLRLIRIFVLMSSKVSFVVFWIWLKAGRHTKCYNLFQNSVFVIWGAAHNFGPFDKNI